MAQPRAYVEAQLELDEWLEMNPRWVRCIRAMIEYEEMHDMDREWSGWESAEVNTPPAVVNALVGRGLVRAVSSSRAHKSYRLMDLEMTRRALEKGPSIPVLHEPIQIDGLFGSIVGHEPVKTLLRFSLQAERPVHVVLVGPPGTAKSLFLEDLATLAGAHMFAGSTTTKSGLVGFLLDQRPRYLILDEMDKMPAVDMSPLLNLMETGMVTRLPHGHQERTHMQPWVFAGANDLGLINQAIRERFTPVKVPGYSREEFVRLVPEVLTRRYSVGPTMAQLIAREVSAHTTNVRMAVKVADLSRGDPRRVLEVCQILWPEGRRPIPLVR